MSQIPWLGMLLVLPVMLILTALGWFTSVPARRLRMLAWSLCAVLVAAGAGSIGIALPPKGQHQLWPQIAAAGMAFISFVSVWGVGLLRTRATQEDKAASARQR